MTHRRIMSLILASIILTSAAGVCAWAGEDPAPVVLVMPGKFGESAAVTDLDVVEAVRMYLAGIGKVSVIAFDPENPTIARYIMERKLGDDVLSKIADPKTAKEIAKLVDADYILSAYGDIRPDLARVGVQLVRTSGKGEWASAAESQIAVVDGPQGVISRNNAISTAASSAVSQIDAAAFGKLKPRADQAPVENAAAISPVVSTPVEPLVTRNLVAEFTAHMNAADTYAQQKDALNVIYELRQAVNIEPKTISIRLKLADAYSAVGMTEEAADELRRAILFKPDDPAVHNALGQFYLSNGAMQQAADQFREAVKLDASNADARISLGNLLWNQNKLDDAAAMFEEASKIDPANVLPHERLYKLYWARRKYAPAIEHLVASKSVSAPLDAVSRYKLVAGVIHTQLSGILGKLDESWKEYEEERIGREDYYRECSDASARIDEFADFLATQTAPAEAKGAHSHGVLCASLLSQSAGTLISYLETDRKQYSEQAALFREEAKTELDQFGKAIGQ